MSYRIADGFPAQYNIFYEYLIYMKKWKDKYVCLNMYDGYIEYTLSKRYLGIWRELYKSLRSSGYICLNMWGGSANG